MPPPPVTSPRGTRDRVTSGASQIWSRSGAGANPAGISVRSEFSFRDKPLLCSRVCPSTSTSPGGASVPSRATPLSCCRARAPASLGPRPWRGGPVNLTPPSPVLGASETLASRWPAQGAQWGRTLGLSGARPAQGKCPAEEALNSRVVQLPLGSPGPCWFPAEAVGGEGGPCDLYPLEGGNQGSGITQLSQIPSPVRASGS